LFSFVPPECKTALKRPAFPAKNERVTNHVTITPRRIVVKKARLQKEKPGESQSPGFNIL